MTETREKYQTNGTTDQRWPQVLESLHGAMSKNAYNAHFLGSKGYLENDGSLTINLPQTANIEAITNQLELTVHRAVFPCYGNVTINYQQALPYPNIGESTPPMLKNPAQNFALLMAQNRASGDIVSYKRIHVLMAGDILAAIILSDLAFWYEPNEKGESKLRVAKDGIYWIARTNQEWQDITMMTQAQVRKAIDRLCDKGLVIKDSYKFDGMRTQHLRIDPAMYMELYEAALRGGLRH